MPFQDPIFNVLNSPLPTGSAQNVLDFIRSTCITAGWVVDQWDSSPSIGSETGGAELYVHPNNAFTGIGTPPFYSFKAFNGSGVDHQAIMIWMNGGYDSSRRVDNQEGLVCKTGRWPTGAADRRNVFSGQWDQAGANRNPADPGMYLCNPWDPVGPPPSPQATPVPTIPDTEISLNTRATSSIDQIYAFFDNNTVGTTSRTITFIWYIDNQMYGFTMGHVLWDDEGVAPWNAQGGMLNAWMNRFDERLAENPPMNNSLGGTGYPAEIARLPMEVINQRTVGSTTFPSGTPDGNALIYAGPVVLQQGRIECSDNISDPNISAVVRPDMSFDSWYNNVQGNAFPNPRITIHREQTPYGDSPMATQERLGFHRPRHISRFPEGGPLTGNFMAGAGTPDWSDSGFSFPQYYAPLRLQRDGDIVTEGTRQYMLFPGNRSGGMPYTQTWRLAGLAFRIA